MQTYDALKKVLTKMTMTVLLLPCAVVSANQPFLDATLRPGAPLYARLTLPEGLLQDRTGYLRLADAEEIRSQGFSLTPLLSSLKLIPRIGSPDTFFLTSRAPVPNEQVKLLLVWESTDKLVYFPFRGIRIGATTTIEALPERAVYTDADLGSDQAGNTEIFSEPATRSMKVAGAYKSLPEEQEQSLVTSSQRESKIVPSATRPITDAELDSIIDDELSEKLRDLFKEESDVPDLRNNESRPAVDLVTSKKGIVSDSQATTDSSSDESILREKQRFSQVIETSPQLALSPGNSEAAIDPISIVSPTAIRNNTPALAIQSGSLLDREISVAGMLFLIMIAWVIFLTTHAYGIRKKFRALGATRSASVQAASSGVGSELINSKLTSATQAEPRSFLASVLREAAEHAEVQEMYHGKSTNDERKALLASIQRKALFEYASELQKNVAEGAGELVAADRSASPSTENVWSARAVDSLATVQPEQYKPNTRDASDLEKKQAKSDRSSQASRVNNGQVDEASVPSNQFTSESKLKPKRKASEVPAESRDESAARMPHGTQKSEQPPAILGEQLSLALVYLNMGETDTARSLLLDITANGDATDKAEAQKILREIEND